MGQPKKSFGLLALILSCLSMIENASATPGGLGPIPPEVTAFYERVVILPDLAAMSPAQLNALAKKSLDIGKKRLWLKIEPVRYGCRSQQAESKTSRLKLKCLSPDEADAADEYMNDDEHEINLTLKIAKEDPSSEMSERRLEEAKNLTSLLNKLIPLDGISFRGSKNGERNKNLRKGDSFSSAAFISTSLSAGVALKFARGETLMIMQTKTCPYFSMRDIRNPKIYFEDGELEVLCPPETKFEVIENLVVDDHRVVFLKEK